MKKLMTFRLLTGLAVTLFFCSMFFCVPVFAATGSASAPQGGVANFSPKLDDKAPIHITSDRMEAHQQARTILFEGHVRVRQSDLTITSNKLKVIMAQTKQKSTASQSGDQQTDPQQRIDYIDFKGDVRVTQQDRVATAQEAIFYQNEQKILLEGSPVVTKGQDKIQGKLITIYLNDNRCVVEGGGGSQVRAVLFPEKKQ
ncbi:MAG: LptA/OstA family protein [Syntrophobacteraceae bacterium]